MRVIVCGGRDFGGNRFDASLLTHTMNKLHRRELITAVIEGDARGADRMAGLWARKLGITNLKYPAKWAKYGKAAGIIRNQAMLAQSAPDFLVAFPGGRGTADMVRIARNTGLLVLEVS